MFGGLVSVSKQTVNLAGQYHEDALRACKTRPAPQWPCLLVKWCTSGVGVVFCAHVSAREQRPAAPFLPTLDLSLLNAILPFGQVLTLTV